MENLLVLDASVALKALLPNPLQGHCQALVATFEKVQPVAPALWGYETTSVLAKAVHFGQITQAEGHRLLTQLATLNVQLFPPTFEQNQSALAWALRLKRAAAYDGYYLALAQSLQCDFWTADSRLFQSLKEENLKWLRWIEEIAPMSW
ncbi:MAG: type II toxin-antitoxin system VapC family toxin [Anaerolineales bacterium]|nr:type II toxin-antitoxin system VapC family toxin [Anaerolineales bacterium]